MTSSGAWITVLGASALFGFFGMLFGAFTGSGVVALFVAAVAPCAVMFFVGRRVRPMGDRRFLFVPSAFACSFIGAMVGYLVAGVMLK